MGQPADAKLIPATAREVCQRTASAAVLDGSIAKIGTQYLLTLKAVNCETGKTLASTEAQATDENHVLAHLGLGRAFVMQGDTAKAKAAYQDFLTLLKNADPDIPVLRQAQAEYTKLH